MKFRVRIDLEELTINQRNESRDEPYLWPLYVIVDGTGINLSDPLSSTLKLVMPTGSHGNLGSHSEDLPTGAKLAIPPQIGVFQGEIDTSVFDFARDSAPQVCALGFGVVALEEDNTTDTNAEQARKAAFQQLQLQLNKAYGELVAQALGGNPPTEQEARRRLEKIDVAKIADVAIAQVLDQVVPGVVAGILVNPLFFLAAADQDDLVGHVVRLAPLRQLLAAGPDGIRFSQSIGGQGEGTYQLRGRMRCMDATAVPGVALTSGQNGQLDLFVRGADRRFYQSSRLAGGSFNAYRSIAAGIFQAAPAAIMSKTNRDMRVFGLGDDKLLWKAASSSGGDTWQVAWAQTENFGVFTSAPGACASTDGHSLCLAARGGDNRFWHAISTDTGASWQRAWTPIGEGVFRGAPALACSGNARRMYCFGRGMDNKIWYATTDDFGANWVGWNPIGDGVFRSAPAAACSVDGLTVHVAGIGLDDHLWYARSRDRAATWEVAWFMPQPEAVFVGDPALACSSDGSRVALAAVGFDLRAWWALLNQFGNAVETGFNKVNQSLYLV